MGLSSRRAFLSQAAASLALARPGDDSATATPNPTLLRNALRLACTWLTDVAQIKSDKLTSENNSRQLMHKHWRGAMRGEYRAADRKWDFSCPVWHTGQAIKALVQASRVMEDDSLVHAAKFSAEFMAAERISERRNKNFGLIFGFEDNRDEVNISAVLECVDGLFVLSDVAGDRHYSDWALDAAFWVARNAYLADGLFRDAFDVKNGKFVAAPWQSDKPGRPLIDDAILLKAWKRTKNPLCRKLFFAAADRLLKDEDPPGNWISYPPCNLKTGMIHPRQAYWWGYPMLAAWQESGERKYLDCVRRAGEWYLHAMRTDGGMFRNTSRDFRTASFGQETSGIACAAILWQDLYKETKEERWMAAAQKALNYCLTMQFREVQDGSLKGAILERVAAPNGTDRSPYYVRDLATIFFVQAASRMLLA
jgi:hypothetical protein